MDPLYSFPLIAQDLRPEEYIIQIADSLQYLDNVINDLFHRIDKRIDENSSRTQNIFQRVETCKKKVDKLTNSKKATKVLSGAKYPAMDCFKNYQTIFAPNSNQIKFNRNNDVNTKFRTIENGKLQEKLEFYHVKVDNSDLYEWLTENQPNVGLGDIPDRVEYINSLLLFDSYDFIYTQNTAKDSQLQSFKDKSLNVDKKQESSLPAAPFSISNKDQASKKTVDSYLYSPGMGEAPAMDVPLDLPHLTGIADDMQFSFETDITIAPSAVFTLPASEHTPVVSASIESFVEVVQENNSESVKSMIDQDSRKPLENPQTTINIQPAAAPPPPPPPPPPMFSVLSENITKTTDKCETDSRPSSETPSSKNTSTKIKKSTVSKTSGDNRANLMEAIRQAGGTGKAKLRPAAAAAITKDEQKAPAGGNDLMADLHAKLSMRRKGISGDRVKTDGSILGVLSAMIPPPMTKIAEQGNAEASSAEDEWD